MTGNRVSLLSWQVNPVAQKDEADGPWDVEELGEAILESKDSWPPINPMRGM